MHIRPCFYYFTERGREGSKGDGHQHSALCHLELTREEVADPVVPRVRGEPAPGVSEESRELGFGMGVGLRPKARLDACVANQCSSSLLIGQLAGEKGSSSSRATSK
eukprot:scaffold53079_cov70-Phaeocystis_antarctica.AAC.1